MERVEAHAIDELGRLGDVPDREIAALARFERADGVEPAERARGRNRVAAMFIASSGEVSGEVPGLQSVATAIGTPARRSASTGGRRVSRVK
jgi:hypothetical protein